MCFYQKCRIFLRENFLPVVSWWPHCSQCFLNMCHCGSWFATMTQKMFSHFTLILESELSNVLETYTRAAWLLNLSILKKNQPKLIIRTGVTVPNVHKCVMVATFTLKMSRRINNYLVLYAWHFLLQNASVFGIQILENTQCVFGSTDHPKKYSFRVNQ